MPDAQQPAVRVGHPQPGTCIPTQLRPFFLGLDWLSVFCAGPWWSLPRWPHAVPWDAPNVRPGTALLELDGTSDFDRRFYIVDQLGDKLATVLCSPKDRKKYPGDFMTVQFSNATLYTGEWRLLYSAMIEMGVEHLGVQRIDLAADGWEGEGGDFIEVVERSVMRNEGRYYGKSMWQMRFDKSKPDGFQFGSRTGNKFLRCYRKKREMKSKGLKPHIVQAWRAALNGHDVMGDEREVGRLEIQLKGKEMRRYVKGEADPDYLLNLMDCDEMVKLYASTTRTLFDFRTHADRARDAVRLANWDFSQVGTVVDLVDREPRAVKVAPLEVKKAIRTLWILYRQTNDREVCHAAFRMAQAMGDLDWMRDRIKKWDKDFRALHGSTDEFSRLFQRNIVERPDLPDDFT